MNSPSLFGICVPDELELQKKRKFFFQHSFVKYKNIIVKFKKNKLRPQVAFDQVHPLSRFRVPKAFQVTELEGDWGLITDHDADLFVCSNSSSRLAIQAACDQLENALGTHYQHMSSGMMQS